MKLFSLSAFTCALFAFAFVSLPAPEARAESITVMTYNLGLLRVVGIDFVPMVEARAAVAPQALARLVEDERPQVILLQEVWRDSYAEAIAVELSSRGYSAVKPRVRSFLGLTSGLLLLVKEPFHVRAWKFSRFNRSTLFDSFTMKGILQAVVENTVTGSRFTLTGTHTVAVDTIDGVPKDKDQVQMIMAQADQILEAVGSDSAAGGMPALLLGDFNVGPRYVESVYARFADSGTFKEAGAQFPGESFTTWDPENPLVKYGKYPEEPAAKIDHIFLRDGRAGKWSVAGARVVARSQAGSLLITPSSGFSPVPIPLSDHYAFLTELVLTP